MPLPMPRMEDFQALMDAYRMTGVTLRQYRLATEEVTRGRSWANEFRIQVRAEVEVEFSAGTLVTPEAIGWIVRLRSTGVDSIQVLSVDSAGQPVDTYQMSVTRPLREGVDYLQRYLVDDPSPPAEAPRAQESLYLRAADEAMSRIIGALPAAVEASGARIEPATSRSGPERIRALARSHVDILKSFMSSSEFVSAVEACSKLPDPPTWLDLVAED